MSLNVTIFFFVYHFSRLWF